MVSDSILGLRGLQQYHSVLKISVSNWTKTTQITLNSSRILLKKQPVSTVCKARKLFAKEFLHLFMTSAPLQSRLRGGRGVTWVNFCWVCAADLSEPLTHNSPFCSQLQAPSQSLLGKYVKSPYSNIITFYFYEMTHFFRLNEEHFTFHLQHKHSGTFVNRKQEELSYPKKSENVRPHFCNSIENYSHISGENATPSSCTSPLPYYN